MAGITHPFVSAVTDDNTPSGAVGPDEWNAGHTVDIPFTALNDVPATYVGQAGKVLVVNASENAVTLANLSTGTGKYDVREPPSSANAMDDEFNDELNMSGPVHLLDAQWTWRNQSTTTATFPQVGRMKLTPPVSATAAWRILEQAVAAGDFTFEMKVSLNSRTTNFASVGMVAIDRTNGDFYNIALQTAAVGTDNPPQTIVQQQWNSVTSFNSAVTAHKFGANSVYLKIERISTKLWFWYSSDGESWINVTADLVDAVVVNGIGIGMSHEHNLAGTYATVEYFRRTV